MLAEMSYYRAHCQQASDEARLARLRLDCAAVLADVLDAGPSAPELLPCLTDAVAFEAYDDAPACLDTLDRCGLRLGVVSNWDVSLVGVLARLGLDAHLAVVVHSAGVGASKPDPRPFAVALERLAVATGDALHVGDHLREDVEGARAAGLRALLLDRSDRAVPDAIRSLAELPARAGCTP